MESRFSDFGASPVFENLVDLLETKVWPEENFENFGDAKLQILVDHFREILLKRNCKIDLINAEWQVLKSFMVPLIKNKAFPYLDIWKRVFTNSELKSECKNVLHLFEILFVMSFTNAKLERMFSRMLRVKSDWHNRLTDHLDSFILRINKEGESLEMFNPEPATSLWFNDEVRRLAASSHRNSTIKRQKRSDTEFVDIAELAISDLEDESVTIFEGFT